MSLKKLFFLSTVIFLIGHMNLFAQSEKVSLSGTIQDAKSGETLPFVVVNININYRRPAVLSDLLTITSQLQQLNGKSGILSQVITLEPEGQVVADALITFVCIDLKTQKALALEGELREKLEQMVHADGSR